MNYGVSEPPTPPRASSRSLMFEQSSPKPYRRVNDDEPATKSRKESADSSPSRKIIRGKYSRP